MESRGHWRTLQKLTLGLTFTSMNLGLIGGLWDPSTNFAICRKNIPVFLGGARGTLTNFRTRKKGAIQWRHKSTFVTWPRHWANSHEQKGRKEWTVWGEFTRRLKNLRWRNWGLKDEQWFQQFFEKLLRPIERSKLFMNHVLKSRFVPWSSASLRMNPWVATWGGCENDGPNSRLACRMGILDPKFDALIWFAEEMPCHVETADSRDIPRTSAHAQLHGTDWRMAWF